MDVRVASRADLEAVRALYEDALAATEVPGSPRLSWDDVRAHVERRVELGGVSIADDGGVAIGFLDAEARGAALVRIERLYVRDAGRAEEIAQSLLAHLADRLAGRGATHLAFEVPEDDERAASLYARWGFVPVSRILGVELDVLRRDLERRPPGESFGSVHVQTDDLPAVERAVGRYVPLLAGGSQGSVVVPPRGGWISVYDDLCDRDPSALRKLARELADRLGLPVLALGVEEGAVVRLLLFDRGRLLDEYLSVQEYYGPLPSGEVVALAANPTLLARYTGGDRGEIRAAAVHGKRPDDLPPAPETAAALAHAMRIEGAEHGYAQALEISNGIRIDREA